MIVRDFLLWARSATPGRRAEAAHAMARAYLYSDLDETVAEAMEAAMTTLLDDPSPDVRAALADALAVSPAAPRHLLLALIADRTDIATLVLARSPALADAELVDIAAASEEALQVAIAGRPVLSSLVAAAIAEVGERAACAALLANPGARVARLSLGRIADRFGDDAAIRETMLQRGDLPATVRQRLVARLGSALGDLTLRRGWLAPARADLVTRDACDGATIAIAAESASEELGELVEHLRVTGELTTALLLRALCAGNLRLFEAALTVLSGLPERRVRTLLYGRRAGFASLYRRAGLPPLAFDAFAAAVRAAGEIDWGAGAAERYRAIRWMVGEVIEHYREIGAGEANELAAMLRRFAADASRAAARDYASACVRAA